MIARRSPVLSIEVVVNRSGTHINVGRNNMPLYSLGPYDFELDLFQAMEYVAGHERLRPVDEQNFRLPPRTIS